MLGEVLKVGDKVKVNLPKEDRKPGRCQVAHGVSGRVVGFEETYQGRVWSEGLRPGVYLSRHSPRIEVETPEGRSVVSVPDHRLEPVDGRQFTSRYKRLRAERWPQLLDRRMAEDYVRDLPDTPFWEGDVVMLKRIVAGWPKEAIVTRINFNKVEGKHPHGDSVYGAPYIVKESLDPNTGQDMCPREQDLDLVRRGNVWRYYHGGQIDWPSLKAEADFFHMIGRAIESWRQDSRLDRYDEAINAIEGGKADGFRGSQSSGFFRNLDDATGYRFYDLELGVRVAKATLAGFGVV